MSRSHKPLTPREERFCEGIAEGMKGRAAARNAGYTATPGSLDTIASRLLRKVQIKNRIAELRKPQTQAALLTRDEKRQILAGMIEDPAVSIANKLRAIELDARLAGHFEPERVTVEAGPITLETIRQRAIGVASALAR